MHEYGQNAAQPAHEEALHTADCFFPPLLALFYSFFCVFSFLLLTDLCAPILLLPYLIRHFHCHSSAATLSLFHSYLLSIVNLHRYSPLIVELPSNRNLIYMQLFTPIQRKLIEIQLCPVVIGQNTHTNVCLPG